MKKLVYSLMGFLMVGFAYAQNPNSADFWATATVKQVQDLKSQGFDLDEGQRHDMTPFLMVADMTYNTDVLQALIDAGADPHYVSEYGEKNAYFPALRHLRDGDNYGVIQKLLDLGVDVNHVNLDGNTPLSFATQWGRPELITLLLNAGAKLPNGYTKQKLNEMTGEDNTALLNSPVYQKLLSMTE